MGLLPRLAGGNEDHLVELEATSHFARGNEVSMVNWIKRATHDTESMSLVRVGAALPGQAGGSRWQSHKSSDARAEPLAMWAAPTNRPGDQQQDGKQSKRKGSEGRGRDG